MVTIAFRKGLVLTFGVINVIVSLDGMKEKETSLTSVCCGTTGPGGHPPTKVSQKMWCITCDGHVAYADLKKAQQVGDSFVVVDQQEVAVVRDSVLGATKKMLGLTVHPAAEVSEHTLQNDSVYLLSPEGAPQIGAYSLLLDTIARHEEYAFLTTWTPTSKASLFQLKVFNGGLVMQQLCWPEQVKSVPDLHVMEALPEHQQMLDQLLPTLSTPFEIENYANTYAKALADLVASKEAVAGITPETVKSIGTVKPMTGGVDLTAALQAMMGQAVGT